MPRNGLSDDRPLFSSAAPVANMAPLPIEARLRRARDLRKRPEKLGEDEAPRRSRGASARPLALAGQSQSVLPADFDGFVGPAETRERSMSLPSRELSPDRPVGRIGRVTVSGPFRRAEGG